MADALPIAALGEEILARFRSHPKLVDADDDSIRWADFVRLLRTLGKCDAEESRLREAAVAEGLVTPGPNARVPLQSLRSWLSNYRSSEGGDKLLGHPLRGLSVAFLSGKLVEEVEAAGLTRTAKVYEIEPLVIRPKGEQVRCPRDGRLGAAYVDCVSLQEGAGLATHMLSYTWGYEVGDIADGLLAFCKSQKLRPDKTYIWICCLCINQHRVKEAQANKESVPFETFRMEFSKRVEGIGHVVALMAPWQDPAYTKRVWCVFELFTAASLGEQACKVSVTMPPREADHMRGTVMECGSNATQLWQALKNVDINKAEASVPEDKDRIFDLIGNRTHELNSVVARCLQDWVVRACETDMEEQVRRKALPLRDLAKLCTGVGALLKAVNEPGRAMKVLNQAKAFFIKDHSLETPEGANAMGILGACKRAQKDDKGAVEALLQAKAIYEATGTLRTSAGVALMISLGAMQRQSGDLDGALQTLEEARQALQELDALETWDGASLLNTIAATKRHKGDVRGCLEDCSSAAQILKKIDCIFTPVGAVVHSSIGVGKRDLGDYTGAVQAFEQARLISERVGTISTESGFRLLIILADARIDAGNPRGAIEAYGAARQILQGRKEMHTAVGLRLLGSVGGLCMQVGDFSGAVDAFAAAKGIHEAMKHLHTDKGAAVLEKLGSARDAAGQHEAALQELLLAKEIYAADGSTDKHIQAVNRSIARLRAKLELKSSCRAGIELLALLRKCEAIGGGGSAGLGPRRLGSRASERPAGHAAPDESAGVPGKAKGKGRGAGKGGRGGSAPAPGASRRRRRRRASGGPAGPVPAPAMPGFIGPGPAAAPPGPSSRHSPEQPPMPMPMPMPGPPHGLGEPMPRPPMPMPMPPSFPGTPMPRPPMPMPPNFGAGRGADAAAPDGPAGVPGKAKGKGRGAGQGGGGSCSPTARSTARSQRRGGSEEELPPLLQLWSEPVDWFDETAVKNFLAANKERFDESALALGAAVDDEEAGAQKFRLAFQLKLGPAPGAGDEASGEEEEEADGEEAEETPFLELSYTGEEGEVLTVDDLRRTVAELRGLDHRQLRLLRFEEATSAGVPMRISAPMAMYRLHAAARMEVHRKARGGRKARRGWYKAALPLQLAVAGNLVRATALAGVRQYQVVEEELRECWQLAKMLIKLTRKLGGRAIALCKSEAEAWALEYMLLHCQVAEPGTVKGSVVSAAGTVYVVPEVHCHGEHAEPTTCWLRKEAPRASEAEQDRVMRRASTEAWVSKRVSERQAAEAAAGGDGGQEERAEGAAEEAGEQGAAAVEEPVPPTLGPGGRVEVQVPEQAGGAQLVFVAGELKESASLAAAVAVARGAEREAEVRVFHLLSDVMPVVIRLEAEREEIARLLGRRRELSREVIHQGTPVPGGAVLMTPRNVLKEMSLPGLVEFRLPQAPRGFLSQLRSNLGCAIPEVPLWALEEAFRHEPRPVS